MSLQQNITIRNITKEELKNRLRLLPGYVSGRVPDRYGLGRALKSHILHSLYKSLHKSFLQKSEGNPDEFGDSWKPLARSTIAQRGLRPGERKSLGILGLGRSGRGLLTVSQNFLWKGIFASNFKRLAPKVGVMQAKAIAGKTAWAILKSRGTKTKIGVLGGRKVPILIDTGRLEASLRPGAVSDDGYEVANREQIAEYHKGKITIGTKVPYAPYVHKVRRLWPSVKKMGTWVGRAVHDGTMALRDNLSESLKR